MGQFERLRNSGNREEELELLRSKADFIRQRLDNMTTCFNSNQCDEIKRMPRFDISNSYVRSEIPSSKETDKYLSTLPALTIPFSDFWMEWRFLGDESNGVWNLTSRITKGSPREDGSFTLSINTFAMAPEDKYKDGTFCLLMPASLDIGPNHKALALNVEDDRPGESSRTVPIPAIHAMALLSCRNVTTSEIRPPRAANRHAIRTEGVALCSYRVVQIQMKKSTHSESRQTGNHRPLSICRGHFKTYDEKPLLGKIKGTWWWQDHVRGDYEYGVIAKDYEVSA